MRSDRVCPFIGSGRYSQFLERSAIKEAGVNAIPAKNMVNALADDQLAISKTLRKLAVTAG